MLRHRRLRKVIRATGSGGICATAAGVVPCDGRSDVGDHDGFQDASADVCSRHSGTAKPYGAVFGGLLPLASQKNCPPTVDRRHTPC
jgi:hypothetical protein